MIELINAHINIFNCTKTISYISINLSDQTYKTLKSLGRGTPGRYESTSSLLFYKIGNIDIYSYPYME